MKISTSLASFVAAVLFASLGVSGCTQNKKGNSDGLVGAWRGHVQFTTGAFATTKDLEFMYAFNEGGTMTESSNYDAAPPVAPAYGVWRKTGQRTFEAKYAYFWTKAPASLDEITKGGGWSPGGHGVLSQKITVSDDGATFDSTIKYEVFDQQGRPTEAASVATAKAVRITF